MWKLNDVKAITYRQGRVFHIVFDDGLEGEVDFSEYVEKGPMFEPLRDEAFCRKAVVEGGTIAWPNGADVAPETLYEKLEGAKRAPSARQAPSPDRCEHVSAGSDRRAP